jgi:hypothetical protein
MHRPAAAGNPPNKAGLHELGERRLPIKLLFVPNIGKNMFRISYVVQ